MKTVFLTTLACASLLACSADGSPPQTSAPEEKSAMQSVSSDTKSAPIAAPVAKKKKPSAVRMKTPPPPPGYKPPTRAQLDTLLSEPGAVDWHQDAKLGIFIHWGPVTLTGVPMSWGRFGPRPGAGRNAAKGVAAEEYDQLYKTFDPVNFDAAEWMELIKGAGAEYFIFTTKHHDGFAMWDTDTTDYNIMNGPFKRDIVKELSEAAKAEDVKTFWYYSQPDWTHPNALQDGHYEKYLPYMRAQLDELVTRYGKVDGIWFDHLATKTYHWDTLNLIPQLRAKQHGILFNQRIGNGLADRKYAGDYATYELRVGPYDEPRPWESEITLSKAWAWHGGDSTKSYDTVLRMFLQTVGNGGTLALNIAPQPDGEIFYKDKIVLARLGEYISKYGAAIKGTRKGPYKAGPWGSSAIKTNANGYDVFLYAMEQSSTGELKFSLPPLKTKPLSAELLTKGQLSAKLDGGNYRFKILNAAAPDPSIIKLSFKGKPPGETGIETFPLASVITPKSITASTNRSDKYSVDVLMGRGGKGTFGEGAHIKNWWSPKPSDKAPALTIALDQVEALDGIMLSESIRSHVVDKFTIKYEDKSGQMKTAFSGTHIGETLFINLGGIETSKLSIDFDSVINDEPNITALTLFRQSD